MMKIRSCLWACLTVLTLIILLYGCTATPKVDREVTATALKLGADVVYLDAHFEDAYEALMLNDFNASELSTVNFHLASIQELKHSLELGAVVVDYTNAKSALETLATHYAAIVTVYSQYLARTLQNESSRLREYDAVGRQAWRTMYEYVNDNEEGLPATTLINYLEYVARGYLLYKVIPSEGVISL